MTLNLELFQRKQDEEFDNQIIHDEQNLEEFGLAKKQISSEIEFDKKFQTQSKETI